MTFPRYPAYKDSGVEWLGHIPEQWVTYRYRRLFTEVADLAETDNEELLTVSHLTGVTPRSEKNVNMFLAESLEGYKRCQQGDTVINTMWAWMGALGVAFQQGVVSPSYNVYRPRPEMVQRLEPRFFDLLYRTEAHIVEINRFSKGVWASRLRLYPQSFFEMMTVCPPVEEQRAIATFLDAETARIDALVAKQEALIATLQEKRRALISHAVTKGLDPAAPMKDSGVPWLGEVPAHWEVRPIKYLVKMESGGTPDKSNLDYWNGTIPWASAKDLKVELLWDTEDHITQHAIDSGAASLIFKESVIIVVRGMILLHTLPVTVNLIPLAINQDLKALHPNEGLSSFFLAWSLRGLADAFLARTDTAGHGTKALRTEDWNDVELGVPPLDEQRAITNYIVQETAQLDTLIAKAQAFIALLREHRAALIAAAVTGRIDVRGWAGMQ